MNGFLAELGKQLAQKWLTLLVLPGLLFVASAAFAATTGWTHALRVDHPIARFKSVPPLSGPSIAVVAITLLLAAAASGLAARALGFVVGTLWLGPWPPPLRALGHRLAARRRTRWEAIDDGRRQLRRRIAFSPPAHATWMADRLAVAGVVVHDEYSLDLLAVWPRLWLLVPGAVRDEVRAARTALDSATVLAGWGLMYAGLGVLSWPGLLIGGVVVGTAWRQARVRVAVYADLVEAVVDLHFSALVAALRPEEDQETQKRKGAIVARRILKGR